MSEKKYIKKHIQMLMSRNKGLDFSSKKKPSSSIKKIG